jgi:hypothetical protein
MDNKELSKISFLNQYGSDAHKAKVSAKVDGIIASGNSKAVHHIASASNISLSPSQVHGIIDHKLEDDRTHPATKLSSWHFGDLKDEHWDKLARHPDSTVAIGAVASMPMKHLRTAATVNPDGFVRQMATNTFVNKKRAGYEE